MVDYEQRMRRSSEAELRNYRHATVLLRGDQLLRDPDLWAFTYTIDLRQFRDRLAASHEAGFRTKEHAHHMARQLEDELAPLLKQILRGD